MCADLIIVLAHFIIDEVRRDLTTNAVSMKGSILAEIISNKRKLLNMLGMFLNHNSNINKYTFN